MNLQDSIKQLGIMKLYDYLDKDPEKNIPKIIDMIEKVDKKGILSKELKVIKPYLTDPDNNWYKLVMSLFTDIDPEVRKATFRNFLINATMIGGELQNESREKYNCNIPWAVIMDPTSACNLHCIGCWAAEYGNRLNLTYEELNSIVEQASDLGTRMFIFTGGEPLARKDDVIKLCEAHPDCQFLAFTNATLIDEKFADDMLRVKNFIPAISVEGFEDATDARRGDGTFAKVEQAMKLLKQKKLPFGVSCCYTSQNTDIIGSEEYFDQMIEWGAKFCWLFTYMPVGNKAVTELMVSAKQREYMYHQVRKFRKTKPLFTMDFWNDGEYVQGCIAGGRRYLHINANGDIEPCAFIHYSDSNIREKTLLEAYQSPLFQAYKEGQPFNSNYLRPCQLLDNAGRLAEMVDKSGAHSTDMESPEDVHVLCGKCTDVAAKWAETSENLWRESHPCEECKK